jgi:phage terminase large subunit-like protein
VNENILEQMIDYSEKIISGEILACKKHIWACQRFLKDMDSQLKNFEYQFNEEKAFKFLKWMTFFKHRKGPLAGTFIDPVQIQIFVYGNIYGWEHKETQLRRFNKAFWQVARKNAKSQGAGALGLYELSAMGEQSSEVYCAATKKEQSRIVWDEANAMVRNCKLLKGKFHTSYGRIQHLKSDSFFRALSKDDKDTGDGLNPECGIIDEYHAHKTDEYYEVLESGMAARKQPLMFVITTAGFELNNPCYRVEYEYVSKILDPNIDIWNDRYFAMINELDKDDEGNLIDDIRDEKCWIKANPIVATNEFGINYLRGRVKTATDTEEKLRNVLTKNFNVWVNMGESKYLNMEKWKTCGKTHIKYKKRRIIFGVDLASIIDLCSISGTFFDNEEIIDVMSHSFMPEATLFARRKSDRVPYDLWVRQGYISVTPGAEVNYKFIMKWIIDFAEKNEIEVVEICFDKWNATQFAQDMEAEGFEMVEVRQGMMTLSEPTKKFRAMVYNKKIQHDNNPVLTWALSNAITKQDSNENIMLDKKKSIERIDPAAALITSFTRCLFRIEKKSVYEERGVLAID